MTDEESFPSTKSEMDKANIEMLAEFKRMYSGMPREQRIGVIAIAALLSGWFKRAGYKSFCRSLIRMLKDGELKVD